MSILWKRKKSVSHIGSEWKMPTWTKSNKMSVEKLNDTGMVRIEWDKHKNVEVNIGQIPYKLTDIIIQFSWKAYWIWASTLAPFGIKMKLKETEIIDNVGSDKFTKVKWNRKAIHTNREIEIHTGKTLLDILDVDLNWSRFLFCSQLVDYLAMKILFV